MPHYTHRDGHSEVTVAGSNRDRELAARARDGRTAWSLADDSPAEPGPDPEPEAGPEPEPDDDPED